MVVIAKKHHVGIVEERALLWLLPCVYSSE